MCRDATRFVRELLLPVLDDQGVQGWLNRPRARYDQLTPQQMLDAGDEDAVVGLALDLVRTA